MKVVINIENLDDFLDDLDETSPCPHVLGLEDNEKCNRISCYECWEIAVKEAEVKNE